MWLKTTYLSVSEMDWRKKLADYQELKIKFSSVFPKKNQTRSSSGPKCAICMDVVNL